jgi:hypothetical protein
MQARADIADSPATDRHTVGRTRCRCVRALMNRASPNSILSQPCIQRHAVYDHGLDRASPQTMSRPAGK